jgi:predicted helicase
MPVNSIGIVTGRDGRVIGETKQDLQKQMIEFAGEHDPALVQKISYRPFDVRYVYYSKKYVERDRLAVMQHYCSRENFGLLVPKAIRDDNWQHAGVTTYLSEAIFLSGTTASNAMNFPLYLYPNGGELDQVRRINFNEKLYEKFRKLAKHPSHGEPDEMAVFDYIYGVLHCPTYRETYAEFLKIDFPRIPWPARADVFWDVSDKGGQLRRLHLMEPAAVGPAHFHFNGDGSYVVEKVEFRAGAVWINETQRFENAPEISWGFYIGGYQPAQKWLKDRKGRTLDFEDVQHYQRILKILAETDRIMETIELPLGADLSEEQ